MLVLIKFVFIVLKIFIEDFEYSKEFHSTSKPIFMFTSYAVVNISNEVFEHFLTFDW